MTTGAAAVAEQAERERTPSYAQMYAAVIEGRVPARKVGRGWKIQADDFDRVRVGLRLPMRPHRRAA